MVSYLDALDELEVPVPRERRVLAALRRRMLELAAERTAGAHPYFIPVEHTAFARSVLGSDSLLAPEVAVVVETDPSAARALARDYASIYLNLPNYTGNLHDFGFTDDDINGGGSDRLIDAVIPWGDASSIAERIREHFDAGADHVCLQVISATGRDGTLPINEYRELAGALIAG
jgi:probable F420-dependent oxidoreductase